MQITLILISAKSLLKFVFYLGIRNVGILLAVLELQKWEKAFHSKQQNKISDLLSFSISRVLLYVIIMSRTSFGVNLQSAVIQCCGWVFVYELSGCGFESRCCHLSILKYTSNCNLYFKCRTVITSEFFNLRYSWHF